MQEINVFALFNSLNRSGAVRLSDCTTNKVGTGRDAVAVPESTTTTETETK